LLLYYNYCNAYLLSQLTTNYHLSPTLWWWCQSWNQSVGSQRSFWGRYVVLK